MTIQLGDLISELEKGAGSKFISDVKYDGDRTFTFTTPMTGRTYKIIWFTYISTMTNECGDIIRFDDFGFRNTWPSSAKVTMHLYLNNEFTSITPVVLHK